MQTFKDIVEVTVVALVIAILVRTLLVEVFVVQGPSMEPTLVDGNRLLVSKIAYKIGEPSRGDVVVLRYPLDPSKDYIKRVVAVGGDIIEIRLGRLYINGQLQQESYIEYPGIYNMAAVTVPSDSVFVMGDHRTNSEDSRYFGCVKEEFLKGKAVYIIWPLEKIGPVR